MKKISLLIAIAGLLVTSAFSQSQKAFSHRHDALIDGLKLTDAQKEQFDKTRYETQRKQIELRAKIATTRLDLQKLLNADSPDKSSIEKKFNEIASLQTAMKMNHFNAWFENNKVLTSEQQKVWKKALAIQPGKMQHKMREMRRHRSDDEMPMHQW